MKIEHLLTEDVESLEEKLGNLSQLGVGSMINVLRQRETGGGRYNSPGITKNQNKFQGSWGNTIGATSEIVDIGQLKKGIADIRKAFRDNEQARAFALYIGGTAVAFGVFDAESLRGQTRTGRLAFDLSKFQQQVDAIDQETTDKMSDWQRNYGSGAAKTATSSYKEKDREDYYTKKVEKEVYTGQTASTGELINKIELIQKIADMVKQPLTAKLVLNDTAGLERRRVRMNQRQIDQGAADLRTRLAKYKLSKKPSATSFEEFLEFVNGAKKAAGSVQFAGYTYSTTGTDDYSKTSAAAIMQGKPFFIEYKAQDPGAYSALKIQYKFDRATMTIRPIYGEWSQAGTYERQVGILDHAMYLKGQLGNLDLNSKEAVIPVLLNLVKDKQYKKAKVYVNSLKQLGQDWPELDVISKSIEVELAKEKK